MAQSSGGGMGILEIALLAAGGYVLYEWWQGLQTPAAAATPAPVTSTGAYTTALTSQPASTVVAAPVSTAIPPATTPTSPAPVTTPVTPANPVPAPVASTPAGTSLSCSNAAYNAMATALAQMTATDPNFVNGQGNVWQWDYYVVNKMNGTQIATAVAAATGSNNADSQLYSACDYVALRAQYSAATGLSGVGRINVPLTWRNRYAGPVGARR